MHLPYWLVTEQWPAEGLHLRKETDSSLPGTWLCRAWRKRCHPGRTPEPAQPGPAGCSCSLRAGGELGLQGLQLRCFVPRVTRATCLLSFDFC